MKKFKTKKNMWKKIASDIKNILNINRSEVQCENRYKTILKRKKKATGNNHTSGASREIIEYENELSKISAIDDSVEPEVLRGVDQCVTKHISAVSSCSSPMSDAEAGPSGMKKNVNKPKHTSISETLVELQKLKEENKERRHKEKMDSLKELINLLKK